MLKLATGIVIILAGVTPTFATNAATLPSIDDPAEPIDPQAFVLTSGQMVIDQALTPLTQAPAKLARGSFHETSLEDARTSDVQVAGTVEERTWISAGFDSPGFDGPGMILWIYEGKTLAALESDSGFYLTAANLVDHGWDQSPRYTVASDRLSLQMAADYNGVAAVYIIDNLALGDGHLASLDVTGDRIAGFSVTDTPFVRDPLPNRQRTAVSLTGSAHVVAPEEVTFSLIQQAHAFKFSAAYAATAPTITREGDVWHVRWSGETNRSRHGHCLPHWHFKYTAELLVPESAPGQATVHILDTTEPQFLCPQG